MNRRAARILVHHLRSVAACGALLLALIGCRAAKVQDDRPNPMPSYAELARGHNTRIERLTRLNAPGLSAVLQYREGDDKKVIQADGALALVLPDRVMFKVTHIGAAGPAIFWAGSNESAYWLFDNRDSDHPLLHHGTHAAFDADAAAAFETPLHPRQTPLLLGVAKLPVKGGSVEWVRGHFVVMPPDQSFAYWIEPERGLVDRVEVFGGQGQWVVADLTEPQLVTLSDAPPGAYPLFPTRIVIRRSGQYGELRLKLPAELDDAISREEVIFDLDKLKLLFDVPPANIIDLDR